MRLGLVLQKEAVALKHLDRCARHATSRILAAAHDIEALVQHLLRDRGRARLIWLVLWCKWWVCSWRWVYSQRYVCAFEYGGSVDI